jgi:hypothetical protein
MTTGYPTAIDSFPDPLSTDTLDSVTAGLNHAAQHTNANDAVHAIELELGALPKGGSATVVARLNANDTAVALKAPLASPTFTGTVGLPASTVLSLPVIDNVKRGFTTTVTAASTTTLTSASNEQQRFTGTTTQTVALPDVTTLALGMTYTVINDSTGVVTVQSSGLNTILAMGANTRVTFTCVLVTGTTAASWSSPAVVAGGGMTLLSTTAITAVASITPPTIDQTYSELVIVISNAATVATNTQFRFTFNNTGGTAYDYALSNGGGGGAASQGLLGVAVGTTANVNNANFTLRIPRYTDVAPTKIVQITGSFVNNTASAITVLYGANSFTSAAAISSIQLVLLSGNWTAQGNVYIYGVK